VHHHVDGRGHLRAQRGERDVDAAQQRAGLDARQAVERTVGVDGGHAARVAGVERLQQVERLAAADFADDEAVRTQPQRRVDQVADRHFALAVLVRLARFEADRVALLELQFAGVFNDQDALAVRDESAQHVEDRGLARRGGARDDDVLVELDDGVDQLRARLGDAAELDQLADGQLLLLELADRDHGAAARERRDDGMHARAVRQARVEARILVVEQAAHVFGHVDGCGFQGRFADKARVGRLQLAFLLDVNLVGSVDQNL